MQICCISQQFTSRELLFPKSKNFLFGETLDYMGNLKKRPELFAPPELRGAQQNSDVAPQDVSDRHVLVEKADIKRKRRPSAHLW